MRDLHKDGFVIDNARDRWVHIRDPDEPYIQSSRFWKGYENVVVSSGIFATTGNDPYKLSFRAVGRYLNEVHKLFAKRQLNKKQEMWRILTFLNGQGINIDNAASFMHMWFHMSTHQWKMLGEVVRNLYKSDANFRRGKGLRPFRVFALNPEKGTYRKIGYNRWGYGKHKWIPYKVKI